MHIELSVDLDMGVTALVLCKEVSDAPAKE